MTAISVPSYAAKISWAASHLQKLETNMAGFADGHPYAVRQIRETDDTSRWILEFTRPPRSEWPLMIGDVVHNLRSGLDHLAVALNPPNVSRAVAFPIVSYWTAGSMHADGAPDESEASKRWRRSTKNMDPDAVAIIKALQPTSPNPDFFHPLEVLSRLSNADKHRHLWPIVSGLRAPAFNFTLANGLQMSVPPQELATPDWRPGTTALEGGATLDPGITTYSPIADIQIRGTVTQAVRMSDDERHIVFPDVLRLIIDWIRPNVVGALSPFIQSM